MPANTTGSYNIAMGLNAMNFSTTGSYNVALGIQALYNNTTASNNTAVGYQAGYSNTTGTQNTAVGLAAGYGLTTGSYSTAIGYGSLGYFASAYTTGSYNTALGHSALGNNTTASNNTAVGYQAFYSNTTSISNTGVGYFAGQQTTGQYNTFIGVGSGYLVSTGSKNTILGAYTGNQGGLDIRTASNYIVLSDGDGNPRMVIDGNGAFFVNGVFGSGAGISSTSATSAIQCFTAWNQGTSGTRYLHYFGSGATFSAVGSITYNGTNTLYNATSDQRLKENIVDAGSGLAKLANVKIRSFDWISNKQQVDFGLIAQELNDVAPEAVTQGIDNEDGSIDKPWQVDASALVPAMIKAIQELNAKVTALEAQLGA